MQRNSDTTDSGEPRIVSYCVKRSMSKSVAVLPQIVKKPIVTEVQWFNGVVSGVRRRSSETWLKAWNYCII